MGRTFRTKEKNSKFDDNDSQDFNVEIKKQQAKETRKKKQKRTYQEEE